MLVFDSLVLDLLRFVKLFRVVLLRFESDPAELGRFLVELLAVPRM